MNYKKRLVIIGCVYFISFLLIPVIPLYSQLTLNDDFFRQIQGNMKLAKETNDREITVEPTSTDPQTWYLRGYIYTEIAKSNVYANLINNPAIVALDAMKKHFQMDSTQKYRSYAVNVMFQLAPLFYNKGIALYNKALENKDKVLFSNALKEFEFYLEVLNTLGSDDFIINELIKYHGIKPNTVLLYSGYCAHNIESNSKAKYYYNQLVMIQGDNQAAIDKGMPLAYIYYSELLEKEKNTDSALKVIERGSQLWTDQDEIMFRHINILNDNNMMSELTPVLEKAVKKKPNTITIWIMLGDNYNKRHLQYKKEGNDSLSSVFAEKAIQTYFTILTTKEIDNDLKFSINFKIGVLYFNPAVKIYNQHNPDLTQQYIDLFTNSQKYLETALQLNNHDKKTMEFLLKIYQILEYTDKAEEMKKKMGN